MWDLWWEKWHWERFFSEYYILMSVSFHQHPKTIFIYTLLLSEAQTEVPLTTFQKAKLLLSEAQTEVQLITFQKAKLFVK
jgi:hypothetical protein